MAMEPLRKGTRLLVGMVQVSKWGWLMVRGPLNMNTRLVGRVMVSKWGLSMAMGPLKRKKTLTGRLSGDG